MINFSKATHHLIPELADYRSKIIDASIVGHSAKARALRLEAAGIMIQASFEEESPLLEQATLLKKNHLEAMQQGEQEKAKEWLLAAYAAYQISLYGPSIKDASQKAMQQRIFLASQLIKSPQEHDCQEQAAFHAENAVDYLLRKKEAEQAQNDFLANCWKEVTQGASDASLLWMKAAESFCSYSPFALIPLLRIERVRHAENKNKRKLLHIACYFSTLLSQQQWKDPLADKNLCRKKIVQATSAGNLALASFWRLTEKEIDFFLQQSHHFSTPNDSEDWRAFALTRIFHTYHSEAMEKADGTRKAMNCDRSLTQDPSALAKPPTERHEISGLGIKTYRRGTRRIDCRQAARKGEPRGRERVAPSHNSPIMYWKWY
jgi:hypothetical protein